MKIFYEVLDDGDSGVSIANTLAEAGASPSGPRSYIVAVENGKRRALNAEEEYELQRIRSHKP
jgi:hypothetical protein